MLLQSNSTPNSGLARVHTVVRRFRRRPIYKQLIHGLLLVVMFVLAMQLLQLAQGLDYGSPGTTDLINYWTAGQLLKAGYNPYDLGGLGELGLSASAPHFHATDIWNPPWSLIWLLPISSLFFPTAAIAWLLVNFTAFLGIAAVVWRMVSDSTKKQSIGPALVTGVVFAPFLFTLRMGQISMFLLLGVVGFLYFIQRRQEMLAGAALAFTTVKPHVVYLIWIVVVWWIIKEKRWRVLLGTGGLLLTTSFILTWLWPDWLSSYLSISTSPPLFGVPTLGGVLRLVLSDSLWVQFLPGVVCAVALLVYLMFRSPHIHWRTAISPLLLISVATAPYGWTFDQIVLLVPYLQIVNQLWDGLTYLTPRSGVILAGLAFYSGGLITQNLLHLNAIFQFWPVWILLGIYVWSIRGRQA